MRDSCPMNEARHKVLMDIDKEERIEGEKVKNITIDDMFKTFDIIYEHYDVIKDARKRASEIVD